MPPQDANPTPSFGGFGVKLGVASKQEIVVWAVRNGLLDD